MVVMSRTRDRRWRPVVFLGAAVLAAACGGSALSGGGSDGGGALDATPHDATTETSSDAGSATACTPGRSIACAGPGGCSANQVCNTDGTAYGPCDCAPAEASTPCAPGQSIACAGPGGCISSQVCNAQGTGFGACVCTNDAGGTLLCVPGQSIACGGPFGCASFQVCNGAGNGYSPCDCPDALSYVDDAGNYPDGYAHLPPPVGNQGYNAISIEPGDAGHQVFLPLFSAPDCTVIPPYGSYYEVDFEQPSGSGPSGTFGTCYGTNNMPCYALSFAGSGPDENSAPSDTYTLSTFGGDGLATGQMDSDQGIIPLVVKFCP
jgi:hypothetical protein